MADYINVTSLNRLARQVLAQCEPLNDLARSLFLCATTKAAICTLP